MLPCVLVRRTSAQICTQLRHMYFCTISLYKKKRTTNIDKLRFTKRFIIPLMKVAALFEIQRTETRIQCSKFPYSSMVGSIAL